MSILKSLCLLGSFASSIQAVYTLRKTYDATNFFDESSFTFIDGPDNFNKGYTKYVGKSEAVSAGLASITPDNKVYLGMDYSTKHTVGVGLGRRSIRLHGAQTFTTGLMIADIERMPASICGVWNA